MPKQIVIVRHGETESNKIDILQGQLPIPLNELGMIQAEKAAGILEREIFDVFITSDLLRTIQTAEIIAKKVRKKFITSPHLRERSLGNLQGKSRNVAFKMLGIGQKEHSHLIWNFIEKDSHQKYEIEPKDKFYNRVKLFANELRSSYKDKTILIVSHGGTIRVLLLYLGFTEEQIKKINIKNTSIITLHKKAVGYSFKVSDTHVPTYHN